MKLRTHNQRCTCTWQCICTSTCMATTTPCRLSSCIPSATLTCTVLTCFVMLTVKQSGLCNTCERTTARDNSILHVMQYTASLLTPHIVQQIPLHAKQPLHLCNLTTTNIYSDAMQHLCKQCHHIVECAEHSSSYSAPCDLPLPRSAVTGA